MKTMVEIAYVGNLPSAVFAFGKNRHSFTNRKPRMVPEAAAEYFLRQDDFCRAEDLNRTMQDDYRGGHVLVRRWGAMGDLLMTRAVCSAVQRELPEYRFSLACEDRWAGMFAADKFWVSVNPKDQPDQVVSLDQVAEQDHRGVHESRTNLMLGMFTTKKLKLDPSDWRVPIPEQTSKNIDTWFAKNGAGKRPLVALQLRGSGAMKSLPDHQIRKLARSLAADADVVLIEPEARRVWSEPGVFSLPGRDVLHSIELLSRCALCICFDSGVLWMAHSAQCKVLCIMGPTRPKERLTEHPLYPDGARAICLNDIITIKGKRGCPACFEAAAACDMTYACMQKQPDSVTDLIVHEAMLMLNKVVSLPVIVTNPDDKASCNAIPKEPVLAAQTSESRQSN